MMQLIVAVLGFLRALGVYQQAKEDGTWSNKQFFVVLLATLGLFLEASAPLLFLRGPRSMPIRAWSSQPC